MRGASAPLLQKHGNNIHMRPSVLHPEYSVNTVDEWRDCWIAYQCAQWESELTPEGGLYWDFIYQDYRLMPSDMLRKRYEEECQARGCEPDLLTAEPEHASTSNTQEHK